jgi:hypothetical protein
MNTEPNRAVVGRPLRDDLAEPKWLVQIYSGGKTRIKREVPDDGTHPKRRRRPTSNLASSHDSGEQKEEANGTASQSRVALTLEAEMV